MPKPDEYGEEVAELSDEAKAAITKRNVEIDIKNLADTEKFEKPADNGRIAICYNSACPDYRIERPANQSCGCKRTKVRGVTMMNW